MDLESIEKISYPSGIAEISTIQNDLMIFDTPFIRRVEKNKTVHVFIALLDTSINYGGYQSLFRLLEAIENNTDFQIKLYIYRDHKPNHPLLEKYNYVIANDPTVIDDPTIIEVSDYDKLLVYCDPFLANFIEKANRDYIYYIPEWIPIVHNLGGVQMFVDGFFRKDHPNMTALIHSKALYHFLQEDNRLGKCKKILYFEPALCDIKAPSYRDFLSKDHFSIIWYARPETHNTRNAFSWTVNAFDYCFKKRILPKNTKILGVGAMKNLKFTFCGREYTVLKKQSLEQYLTLYDKFDIGVSFIYAPHPGLVHFEMACSGLNVISNYHPHNYNLRNYYELNYFDFDLFANAMIECLSVQKTYDQRVRDSNHNRSNFRFSWDDVFTKKFIGELLT